MKYRMKIIIVMLIMAVGVLYCCGYVINGLVHINNNPAAKDCDAMIPYNATDPASFEASTVNQSPDDEVKLNFKRKTYLGGVEVRLHEEIHNERKRIFLR